MIGVKKKEDIFFTLFKEQMDKIITAGEAFVDLVNDYNDVNEKIARIKTIETECDIQTHKILKKLNGSFITPFDREDIYEITRENDDIVDSIEEVANRFGVFDVKTVRPEAIEMADLILQAIKELNKLFEHLPEVKKPVVLMEQIIEVNRIENEGDVVYRKALATLFRTEKDPIEIIKWKHLYEQLEASLDSCENVANMIEGVVMKYA